MKLGVLFGGNSYEHDISIRSAKSVLENLNQDKYEVIPIYLDRKNNWFVVKGNWQDKKCYLKKIKNVVKFLQKLDVVFPVMHGKYGEDGSIQGFLELVNVSYVGCDILASAVSMNKKTTKNMVSPVCNVAKDILIRYENNRYVFYDNEMKQKQVNINKIDKLIIDNLCYPVFVKPTSLGSSVGISKVLKKEELKKALDVAFEIDNEVIIEECIKGRELECAIFNGDALMVGEVMTAEDFYSYSAKYENKESYTIIPAKLNKDINDNILDIASRVFKTIKGTGLARIDFFLENETNKIYLNEINTMPGFTDISMYPKLVEESGISYSKLLDELINLAIKKRS